MHTVRFKNELERNITIKLGYANAKIYECQNPACERPGSFKSFSSAMEDAPPCPRPFCGGTMKLLRHVSFVDCPGHDILMATMLNGAAVMDAALLLIAANEPCPQPQTSEHLAAIEIMKLKHIIVLQNKVDLIREQQADEHHQSILNFVKGTVADSAPIVPISAQLRYNIDALVEYIVKKIPVPVRDFATAPKLIVIRSFDVNKPGAEVDDLKGGVAGGSLLKGVLRLGQEIEVRPGVVSKDSEGKINCKPIRSKIVSLLAEKNELKFAVPGGLIGVGTLIDPQLTRGDRLVGQVLGSKGSLPSIYTEIEINYFLLRRLLGVKTDDKKQTKVAKLAKNEILMVNIGSTSEGGRVVSVKADLVSFFLYSSFFFGILLTLALVYTPRRRRSCSIHLQPPRSERRSPSLGASTSTGVSSVRNARFMLDIWLADCCCSGCAQDGAVSAAEPSSRSRNRRPVANARGGGEAEVAEGLFE